MATRGTGAGGVKIPIRLDKSDAERDGKELGQNLKRSVQPVVDVFDAAKTAVGLMGSALSRLRSLTGDVISASAEQERVERRVLTAIQQRNKFTREDLDLLQEANSARQQATAIGDEVQLQLQGTAAALGVEARFLGLVTDATLGLSEVTGQGLNEALKIAVKLYQGNTQALAEYGIKVSSGQEGLDLLASKMALAAARTDTFGGKVDRLRGNFGDLLEEIGNSITQNEDVRALIDELSESVLKLIEEVRDNGPEAQRQISGLLKELRELGSWISEHKGDLITLAELFVAARALGAAGGVVGALRNLGAGGLLSAAGSKVLPGLVGGGGLSLAGLATFGAASGGAAVYGLSQWTGSEDFRRMRERRAAAKEAAALTVQKSNPTFQETAYLGQGGESGFGVEDYGGGFLPETITVDSKDRARRQAEAEKKAREEKKKAEDEFLRWLDERRKTRANIARLDVEAKQRAYDYERELDVIDLQAKREAVEERNRILLHGFDTMQELRDAERQQTEAYYQEIQRIGVQGLAGFFSGIGQAIATGDTDVGALFKKFIAGIGQQFGGFLVTLGGATIAAATASTPAPWTWGITGGPAGIGAGIGLIAAGGILTGLSTALGASAGGGGGAAAQTPRAPRVGGGGGAPAPGQTFDGPALDVLRPGRGGAGQPGVTVINVNVDGSRGLVVGSSEEVARWLQQLLSSNAAYSAT